MTNETNLPFEQILDWLEGRLPAEVATAVERQVVTAGPEVHAQVAWLRAFTALQQTVTLAKPPATVRAQLTEQFARYAAAKQQPNLLQRLVAALTFDSARQPGLVGVRTGQAERARQFVYSTGPVDVTLNLQLRKQTQRLNLIGQILANEPGVDLAAFCVQLLQATHEIGITQADDLGEFSFDALEPGTYQLVLSTDDQEIVLPAIDVTI